MSPKHHHVHDFLSFFWITKRKGVCAYKKFTNNWIIITIDKCIESIVSVYRMNIFLAPLYGQFILNWLHFVSISNNCIERNRKGPFYLSNCYLTSLTIELYNKKRQVRYCAMANNIFIVNCVLSSTICEGFFCLSNDYPLELFTPLKIIWIKRALFIFLSCE